jgi:hypothetical protein
MKCQHGRRTDRCKDCGGKSICEHARIKIACRDCGGAIFCIHGKVKYNCRECNGSQICIHNKFKNICRECSKNTYCEHGKRKNRCKDCGGSQICIHHRDKSSCRDCSTTILCIHKKFKSTCKECVGSSICIHGRNKYICKDCGGNGICMHNKTKSSCKECGGSAFCSHGIYKRYCKECDGSRLCISESCYENKNKKYNGYCLRCFVHLFPDEPVVRNYKTKEKSVTDHIKEVFPSYNWICDKQIQDGCSKKRPDVFLDLGHQVIIIEIDENQHETYDCSCDNKRLMMLSQDIGHRPMVMIRFNPDDYISSSGKVTSCWNYNKKGLCLIKKCKQKEWNSRLESLDQQIRYWYEHSTDKTVEVIQLFYNDD